jgi:hypothetical protein
MKSIKQRIVTCSLVAMALVAVTLAGCYPYPVYTTPPPTTPPASKFDQVWSAAYGAAQDTGVAITTADRGTGVIRGIKDQVNVTINVRSQADGSVVAEINAKGPGGQEKAISDQISRAYERRMGR